VLKCEREANLLWASESTYRPLQGNFLVQMQTGRKRDKEYYIVALNMHPQNEIFGGKLCVEE
jgi:hypothetical protein